MDLERLSEEEPRQPAVNYELLTGARDIALQLIDVAVNLPIQGRVQIQLQSRHAPLLGHPAIHIADADPAKPQLPGQLDRHGTLAATQVAIDHDRLALAH